MRNLNEDQLEYLTIAGACLIGKRITSIMSYDNGTVRLDLSGDANERKVTVYLPGLALYHDMDTVVIGTNPEEEA